MAIRTRVLTLAPALALAARVVAAQTVPTLRPVVQAADEAWDSGRRSDARVGYADVVRRDTAAVPRAVFRLAQLSAWAGRYEDALALYAAYARLEPTDVDARIGAAQTLAWAGRYDEADDAYAKLATVDAAESARGRARVAAWRGDLVRSETLWRDATTRFPGDADAWVGLARVLAETGRPVQANEALQRALDARPTDVDARALRLVLDPDLRTTVAPSVTMWRDSDANQATTVAALATLAPTGMSRARAIASHRDATLRGARGSSTSGRVAIRLSPLRSADLHLDLGATRLGARTQAGATSSQSVLTGGVHVVVRPTRRAAIGGGVSREAFDETASVIAAGIVTTAATIDAEAALPARVAAAFGVEHAMLRGATPNSRWAVTAALQWRAPIGLSLGIGSRAVGYRVATTEGYFAPRQFTLIEATARHGWGRARGWFGETDVGLGSQFVDAGSGGVVRRAARLALALGYRLEPGREIAVRWAYANAAGGAGVADAARYAGQLVAIRALLIAW